MPSFAYVGQLTSVPHSGRHWRMLGKFADVIHLERWPSRGRWIALVFHHLTDGSRYRADDPLVKDLRIDLPWDAFRDRVSWLSSRYEFISLEAVIQKKIAKGDRQKLLMCFDDGYASVFHLAAPILQDLKIPWCFFINPGFV